MLEEIIALFIPLPSLPRQLQRLPGKGNEILAPFQVKVSRFPAKYVR
jgi:hypothetical protein